jgi:hypothetical protein
METVGDILTKLPAPGGNAPPLLEVLRDELEVETAALLGRRDELLAAAARMPNAVADDEVAGNFSDMTKAIAGCIKNAEAARTAKKEVFLAGGRAVDGHFKKLLTDPLLKAKASIEDRLGLYLRAKAAREKAVRDQAERAAREAERLAQEAARKAAEAMQNEKDLQAALDAQARAEEAAIAAAAASKAAAEKPAAMARTRGDIGSLGTLRQVWTFKDVDRDSVNLEMLRNYLSVDEIGKAVRLYIKAMGADEMKRIVTVEGRQPIRGVTIFEEQGVIVR